MVDAKITRRQMAHSCFMICVAFYLFSFRQLVATSAAASQQLRMLNELEQTPPGFKQERKTNARASLQQSESTVNYSLSFGQIWGSKAKTTSEHKNATSSATSNMTSLLHILPESTWLTDQDPLQPWETRYTPDKTIPRIIHKILLTKTGKITDLDLKSEALGQAHQSWREKNPGYELQYFSLNLARAYLQAHFHPAFLRAFDCIQAFAGKTNLFRLAVMYREGGWYSDWKEQCLEDNLLDWLGTQDKGLKRGVFNTTLVIAMSKATPHHRKNKYVMNGFFGAQERHPVLARALEQILLNVQAEYYGPTPQANTGPGVLGSAYKDSLQQYPNLKDRAIVGKYRWNEYYFMKHVITHKCQGCQSNVDSLKRRQWPGGNDYVELHDSHHYYCQDAQSILKAN